VGRRRRLRGGRDEPGVTPGAVLLDDQRPDQQRQPGDEDKEALIVRRSQQVPMRRTGTISSGMIFVGSSRSKG